MDYSNAQPNSFRITWQKVFIWNIICFSFFFSSRYRFEEASIKEYYIHTLLRTQMESGKLFNLILKWTRSVFLFNLKRKVNFSHISHLSVSLHFVFLLLYLLSTMICIENIILRRLYHFIKLTEIGILKLRWYGDIMEFWLVQAR